LQKTDFIDAPVPGNVLNFIKIFGIRKLETMGYCARLFV